MRKFARLHIDQAIELMLKERVRLGGKSIYKNPKETISIYGAYEILDKDLKCAIPERPDQNCYTKSGTTSNTSTLIQVRMMQRFTSNER